MSTEPSSWPSGSEIESPPTTSEPESAHAPQAGRFYRVDSSRSSFTELWRDTRSPMVLVAWLSKLLRIKLPGSVNDPNVVSLRPFVVPDEAVDERIGADVRQKLAPTLRELTDLGFGPPVYYAINDLFHHSRTCQAVLLHRDGRAVARITHRAEGEQRTRIHFFTEFLTPLASGRFLWSSSAKSQLYAPPACQLNWDHKAAASQLWVSHRQALDAAGWSGDSVLYIRSHEEMLDVLEQHHEEVRDFQLQRGIFCSMRGEDLAQAEALDKNLDQARIGQMRHPEIMAQLERLQKKQVSWTSAILVLLVSIALFIGAGTAGWGWSWEIILTIIGVLFVHEAGHYAAMKLFRYRNVRMFFIPFFGAAVSGHHYSAPGWKKVMVSLMGPLPGIALGGVVGIAGLIKGNELMTRVAIIAVILNGLQLLPVLPLDGGRVMHALLFSRHHYLDTVFRIIAAAALVGIGLLSEDKILLYLGVFMLVGVPTAFKAARIATELRQQGLAAVGAGTGTMEAAAPPGTAAPMPVSMDAESLDPSAMPRQPMAATTATTAPTPPATPPAAGEHNIPQPIAEAIIDRLKQRLPRVKSARQIAMMTGQVYEMLVTRPPGILASIGFLLLHGASFAVGLVLLAVLIVAQQGSLWDPFLTGAINPTHTIEPAAMATWDGSAVPSGLARPEQPSTAPAPAGRGYDTIVATFSSPEEASAVFEELKQRAPAHASMVLFGQSVLLSLRSGHDSERTQWFAELEARTDDVFVDTDGGFRTSLTLTCRAPRHSEGLAIEREMVNYLDIPGALWLIPPWASDDLDPRTDEERARHELARSTYRNLQKVGVYESPELDALSEQMGRATRRGDQAEWKRLLNERSKLQEELRIRELRRVCESGEEPMDRELAERYIAVALADQAEQAAQEASDGAGAASAPAARQETSSLTAEEEAEFEESDRFLTEYYARQRTELGPLLGQLPVPDDGSRPSSSVMRYSHRSGHGRLSLGDTIGISVLLEDVAYGAPAIIRWLERRGCTGFKYNLENTALSYFDDED